MTATYDANNRQVGVSYDANGNPGTANCAWNGYSVENRLNTQTSMAWPEPLTTYGYDPNGKRVMKRYDPDPNNWSTGSSPTWEFYFYGITGQRLVTVDCAPGSGSLPSCSVVGQNVYFGSKLLVSNGVNVVTDRLGSVRGNSIGEHFSYYPYGEERTSTVDLRDKFATYFRDGVGQDYADQRYYNSGMGRFWTVDPGGIATADTSTPASLNRYSYVQGDPVNSIDPHGMLGDDPNDPVTAQHCIDDPDDPACYGPCGSGGLPMAAMLRTLNPMLDMDPGCGPVSGPGPAPSGPPSVSCGASNVQQFVQTNFAAAATTAAALGIGGETGDADILALSGVESGWGSFTGGFPGAYFGMQARVGATFYPGETKCATIWLDKDHKKAGNACEMEFSSFAAAAAAFAKAKGSIVNGAADPTTFFSNLYQGAGYASQTFHTAAQYVKYMLTAWQMVDNCIQALGLVK